MRRTLLWNIGQGERRGIVKSGQKYGWGTRTEVNRKRNWNCVGDWAGNQKRVVSSKKCTKAMLINGAFFG